jgi:hypothetical protein
VVLKRSPAFAKATARQVVPVVPPTLKLWRAGLRRAQSSRCPRPRFRISGVVESIAPSTNCIPGCGFACTCEASLASGIEAGFVAVNLVRFSGLRHEILQSRQRPLVREVSVFSKYRNKSNHMSLSIVFNLVIGDASRVISSADTASPEPIIVLRGAARR